ncbi:hypothetical protein PAMP_015020 [Pampus punctatissimus]
MNDKKQWQLPKIREKKQRRDDGNDLNPNKEDADRGKVVSTHFPSLPVKAVSQRQVRILNERSSPSLDLKHSHHKKHGFDEFKLPVIPAIVKQDCGKKGDRQSKQDGLSTHLPPIQTMTQASCQSVGHKPIMAVLKPTTEQDSIFKLPVIKNPPVQCSRPKSVNLHRLPCVLPPISRGAKELDRSFTLPAAANMQKAESLRKDKAKKNKKTVGIF